MNQADRLKELNRVCSPKRMKAEIRQLLEWMGAQTPKGKKFYTNQREIYFRFFAKGSAEEPDPNDLQTARNLIRDARRYLDRFYQNVLYDGDVWITLPNLRATEPFSEGGYTLRFFEGARPTRYIRALGLRQLGPASTFWKRMIDPINPRKGLLIYSAEQPEFGPYADDRGLYAGSGEVAAAFLVGSRVAHFNNILDTKRSHKCDYDELRNDPSWLVFLGSSLSNEMLQILRTETKWAEFQDFHFETECDSEGVERGVLHRGKLNGPPQETYRYTVLRPRRHEVDYALISYFLDHANAQALIALQGISTIGTWAAARYLCSDDCVQALEKLLAIKPDEPIPPFEVLLKVDVREYAPHEVEVVHCVPHRRRVRVVEPH